MTDTSNPETGEALDTQGFADSLMMPAPEKAPKQPKAEEPAEEAETVEETEEEVEASDAEDAADDDADDEDTTEEEVEDDDEAPLYTVKVDGVEKQVSLEELRKNYSLESASQKRMREAAELRAQAEAAHKQLSDEAQKMRAAYQAELAKIAQPSEQEPDWLAMSREDPLGYIEKRAEWDARQAKQRQAAERQQQMAMEDYSRRLEEGRKRLFDAIPEWTDPDKYQADTKEIGEAAVKAYGFTKQEMLSVLDPRMIQVLRDAYKYQKIREKRPETAKKVVKTPKVMKPGASVTKAERKSEAARSVADRLKKTGSTDDFAAWIAGGE